MRTRAAVGWFVLAVVGIVVTGVALLLMVLSVGFGPTGFGSG